MAPTLATLGQYVSSVRSQYIDVDGWFGAQCWDQWSHYATNFIGVPSLTTWADAGGSNPHSGYACNVFHNARAAGLEQWFEILPASATPRPGDVAFWDYGTVWYPWSHVATVLEALPGGRMLRCLTQNPGAVQIADLITNGLIGYLRPRALTVGSVDAGKTPTLTQSQKENLMANANGFIAVQTGGKQINAIFNTESGFFHEFESADGKYNTNILRTFGVAAPSSIVGVSHYNAVKSACAAVRAGRE
ncbi:CHAP domain-containing protein [Leucobacter japonicus]|uniref:CHAP domain-containing protein n=1 Tax=Leucobacter japonicus TaxID=1461259 RepID=UPI0006A785F1|nr:CHAP domain-containing protein [Leucobacter japonicus]